MSKLQGESMVGSRGKGYKFPVTESIHLGGKIPNSISPLQPPNGALMHVLCEGRKSTPFSIKYFQAREEREGGKTEKGEGDE